MGGVCRCRQLWKTLTVKSGLCQMVAEFPFLAILSIFPLKHLSRVCVYTYRDSSQVTRFPKSTEITSENTEITIENTKISISCLYYSNIIILYAIYMV